MESVFGPEGPNTKIKKEMKVEMKVEMKATWALNAKIQERTDRLHSRFRSHSDNPDYRESRTTS